MLNSAVIDVAIGIMFVYLLVSLICSNINEWIATLLKTRAKTLEQGIRNMLNNPSPDGLVADFFKHSLIKGLTEPAGQPGETGNNKPSYIPSRTFALALLDTIAPADPGSDPKTLVEIRKTVATLTNEDLKKSLLTLIDAADNDLEKARENIEHWFDDAMDRASGWYKRYVQKILLGISLVVVVALNIDSIQIVDSLWKSPKLRDAVGSFAQDYVKAEKGPSTQPGDSPQATATPTTPSSTDPKIKDVEDKLEQLKKLQDFSLPIGWSIEPKDPRIPQSGEGWLLKALGWIITVAFISLGAPFWFDLLNKFVNVRRTGQLPPKA